MGADEGFEDERPEFSPPPAPDDRLWRHPAEMAQLDRSAVIPPTPVHELGPRHPRSLRRSPIAVGFVSVVGGAVLACSLMFTAGGIGDEPDRVGLAPLATLVPTGGSEVGIVSVEVDTDAGARTASALVLGDGVHVLTSAQVVPADGALVLAGSGAGAVTTAASTGAATSTEPAARGATRPRSSLRVIDEQGIVHQAWLVAIDAANDLAVLRTDGDRLTPYDTARTATLPEGAEVTMHGGGYGAGLRRWGSTVAEVAAAYHGDLVDLVGVALLADPLPAAATGAVAIDADGALVGLVVVDLRVGSSGGATRLPAVVVPADRVLHAARQFLGSGQITHAWLGIEGTPVADGTRQVARRAGASVEHVVAGSPAALAGLRTGDVLLVVCDVAVTSIDDVVRRLLELDPGTRCKVDALRDGAPWHTEVELGHRAA